MGKILPREVFEVSEKNFASPKVKIPQSRLTIAAHEMK